MTEIIRFAKTKPITEPERLIKILQPSIDDISKFVSCQFVPFMQSMEKLDFTLNILYTPIQLLIKELTEHQEHGTYQSINETQLRGFQQFLEHHDARHGTLLLYWLHNDDCYQFQFVQASENNYVLFSVWKNDQNLFESALDQTAEHFNIPRRQLINNPFNRKPFKVSNEDTVIME